MFRKSSIPTSPHDYVEERLSAFIDGQLSEEERVQVRKHLQSCSRCQTSMDTLGWTVKLLKQAPLPPLPRQFTLPIPEPKSAPGASPWLRWGIAAASAAAALAFVFLVTVDLLSQRSGGTRSVAQQAPAGIAQPTLVAAVPPTSAPVAIYQAVPPTSAPIPELPTSLPPVASQLQATAAPAPTQERAFRESTAPTETEAPMTTKLAAPTPSCEGCGGGVGGGPSEETPQTLTITAASAVVIAGSVKDGPLFVRSAPSDKAPRLGLMARDTALQILMRDSTGNWLQIVYPLGNDQGSTAWVGAKFVSLKVPIESVPTAQPPTVTPTPPSGMSISTPEGVLSPSQFSEPQPPESSSLPVTAATVPNETWPSPAWAMLAVSNPLSPNAAGLTRASAHSVALDVPSPASMSVPPLASFSQDTPLSPIRLGQVAAIVIFSVLSAAFWLTL